MIKAYDDETGILIGYFDKGAFITDPGHLIMVARLRQQDLRDSIDWYEKRIELLVKIQKSLSVKP